jgi:hypothetical protein
MAQFHYSLSITDSKAIARNYSASNYNGESVLSVSADTFGEVPVFFNIANKNQRFDCVEINPDVYNSGLEAFNELKAKYPSLTYQNKNVFDMDFSQYDRINLDFCGQLTNKLIFDLIKHLNGFKGKVFITLLRGREQFEPSYYGTQKKGEAGKTEFRDDVFPQLIKKFTGLDVYLPRHDYQNRKEGGKKPINMMVYSFHKK